MSIKVLVVDDDHVLTRLLSAQLNARDYVSETANDGLEALVKLKHSSYDIVVLDVMMPEINGYDVCFHLRFNKEFVHLPIILLTEREQELQADISARSNIAYLSKPVQIHKLTALIKTVLGPPSPQEQEKAS